MIFLVKCHCVCTFVNGKVADVEFSQKKNLDERKISLNSVSRITFDQSEEGEG